MRLGTDLGRGTGPIGLRSPEAAGDHRQGVAQEFRDVDAEEQARQGALQDLQGGCGRASLVGRGLSAAMGSSAHQRTEVVGKNLGRHVDDQGVLTQSADGLELQAVFEPSRCLGSESEGSPRI
jgi:hypothetical protein